MGGLAYRAWWAMAQRRLTVKAAANDKNQWGDELPPEFEADQK